MYSYPLILIVFLVIGSVRLKENVKGNANGEVKTGAKSILQDTNDFPCRKCDYIVKGYHNKFTTMVKPGQVICFDAAIRYGTVLLTDIKGTRENPIIIRNCGGVAKITSSGAFGLKFEQSQNFKLV